MIDQQAHADYDKATRKAFWNQIKSWLTGRSNDLLPFDEVQARMPMASQHYRGLDEVPLALIAGSVGRYRDFDRAFLPKQKATKDRWLSISRARYEDVELPAIELYKIGEIYFVKDGNHRISVARERKQEYIDAHVIEIETPVPLTPDIDLDELIRKAEQAEFFRATNLHHLRPDNDVCLTLPGQYEKLLEHINVHRWYLGVENNREIGWEEAVQSWYDRIYLPLVRYIHDQDILKDFPDRTATDLYLWIIEHRSVLRGDPESTPVEEAVHDFVRKRSENPARRVLRAVQETAEAIGLLAEDIVLADAEVGRTLPGKELIESLKEDDGAGTDNGADDAEA